jgi:hypothetical protein
MNKIKIKTCGIFKDPVITIETDDLIYSSFNSTGFGMQINEILSEKENDIKKLCHEISDKIRELNKIIKE